MKLWCLLFWISTLSGQICRLLGGPIEQCRITYDTGNPNHGIIIQKPSVIGNLYILYVAPELNGAWQKVDEFFASSSISEFRDEPNLNHRFYCVKSHDSHIKTNLVWIGPGTFVVDSAYYPNHPPEYPPRCIFITEGFWMSKFEITQKEYLELMGGNPSFFTGDLNRPVENVSWIEATDYCRKLTEQEKTSGLLPIGYFYRLPTEAEWEYACRAGSTTRFSYGEDPNITELDNFGWYAVNSGSVTHEVGMKLPNRWGLYDMHGNVIEWCYDWSSPTWNLRTFIINPKLTGEFDRAIRGGSWSDSGDFCHSSSQHIEYPEFKSKCLGFRPILVKESLTQTIVITKQLGHQSVLIGRNTEFTIEAKSSFPLSYQWFFNGKLLMVTLHGKMVVQNVQTNQAGHYCVKISNLLGSITSDDAVLSIQPTNPTPGFVWIPPGSFLMGSPSTEKDRRDNEGPQTEITIANGFWMSKYEVTQKEYFEVTGIFPMWDTTNDLYRLYRPIANVSWYDATNYCSRLTLREKISGRLPFGYTYRLPTEAEWEYACRAGSTTRFSFGDDFDYLELGKYAWYGANSEFFTHTVGQKLPNAWGLYDMYGNVWEWCWSFNDHYPGGNIINDNSPGAPGAILMDYRVVRGSCIWDSSSMSRSAYRRQIYGGVKYFGLGFRTVLVSFQ